MPSPTLWCCRSCAEPLGLVIDGQLEPCKTSRTLPDGGLLVWCTCGKKRRWFVESPTQSETHNTRRLCYTEP